MKYNIYLNWFFFVQTMISELVYSNKHFHILSSSAGYVSLRPSTFVFVIFTK